MTSIFSNVGDKHIPVYRVMWVSEIPHYCGEQECTAEGRYEIRLEQDESVWANSEERDQMLEAMEAWWNRTQGSDDWD